MIGVWNEHMAKIFLAAGVVCLDESMSIWQTDGLVLGGCFALANPTPSGTNTTPRAVDCRAFCFRWSWSRGRITLPRSRSGGASSGGRRDC
jgi:hypothetical protein